jgi:hypothetical protein
MAQAFKIPRGGTFPPLNGMIPQWWSPATTSGDPGRTLDDFLRQYAISESDNEIRFADPRWANSFKKTFSTGSSSQVDFRAVCFNHPGRAGVTTAGRYLYLSWHMKVHPMAAYQASFVDVGFRPRTGDPTRARITLNAAANAGTTDEGLSFAGGGFSTSYLTNPTGTAGGWGTVADPAWLQTNTRIWTLGGVADFWWAVHMRVPLTPLAGGLDLTGTFGLGFYLEADFGNAVIDYHWPTGLAATPSQSVPSTYQNVFLEIDALSPGDTALSTGVSLAEDHIGTHGVTATFPADGGGTFTVSNDQVFTFTAGSVNTLFARPKNEDPVTDVAAGDIHATFKLANFGSATMSDPASWAAVTGTQTAHPLLLHGGGEGDIEQDWTVSSSEATFYAAHPHQCIMVTLFSGNTNITFLNDSAARNMDFGAASKFSREVEVSVRGLNDGFPLAQRDVYIYVERKNVPAKIDDETRRKYAQVQETLRAVSSVEGEFPEEQRYVSIVRGDLRHLRFIDFPDFLGWLSDSSNREELVISSSLFVLLRAFGIEANSISDLINRYSAQASAIVQALQYDSNGQPQFTTLQRQIINVLLANISYRGTVPPAAHPLPPIEQLRQFMPAVRYHVYYDTGRIDTRNGVNRPVLASQPSFGYYLWLDHDVQNWELRLQGAQKLAENLYLVRPPTEGSVKLNTSIHAVKRGEENQIEPPEVIVPFPKYPREDGDDCKGCLKALLCFLKRLFKK